MTRKDAIKIIQNEYKCVDRECDIERSCGKCPYMIPSKEPILQAYDMAIKALLQEPSEDMTTAYLMGYYADKQPCDDAISREDARMMLTCEIKDGMTITEYIKMVDKRLRSLPSVTQKSETETWNGIHGQITAPKGTFEKIWQDAESEE